MKKIFKGLGLGFLALALVVGVGANNANATTTYAVNAITETGALTVTSAGTLGLVAGANAINIGADSTAKTITIGATTTSSATVLNFGTGNLDINGVGVSADFTLDADLISIDGTGASNFTVTGSATEDLSLINTGGSVNITATESAVDSIKIESTLGGIDILASGATAEDIDIINTGGSVNLSATEDATDAITIATTAGGIDITAVGVAADDLNLVGTLTSVNINSSEAVSDAINIDATGTAGGIDIDTTDGAITIDAAGADNSDITITVGDNFTLDGATTSIYAIGASLTSGTITLGGASQTGATTIYGGSTTNAVQINANVGAVATEAHGLDVISDGELSSGDNLVGINSVLTPTGSSGTWASAVYGKVVQGATKHTNGYISGGEFEVADTNAAPSEVHTLVLDSNSTVFDGNSSYIWGQDFGTADMPNFLKLTGTTIGAGNMIQAQTAAAVSHTMKIL